MAIEMLVNSVIMAIVIGQDGVLSIDDGGGGAWKIARKMLCKNQNE